MISCVTLWQVTSPFCALDFKIARRNQEPCTTDIQVHWTNYLITQPNKYLLSTYLAGCCIHRVVNQDRFGIYFPSPSSLVGCQPQKAKALVKHRVTLQTDLTSPCCSHLSLLTWLSPGEEGEMPLHVGKWWEGQSGKVLWRVLPPLYQSRSRGCVTVGRKPPMQPESSMTTTVR